MLLWLLLCASALAAISESPVDLTPFEIDVLPRWMKGFKIVGSDGQPIEGSFRDAIDKPYAAAYGTADMIHLLSTVNQLNFSDAKRDAWAAALASFQKESITCKEHSDCPGFPLGSNWSGFYAGDFWTHPEPGAGEPWHSTGDITSSFYLLGRWPTALNPMYIAIAQNESLWQPTFDPIVYKSIHKIIGIMGTLLMQAPNATADYAPFLKWWAKYIDEHEQASTGFLCDVKDDLPSCKCNDPACSDDKCLASKLHECVAPTFATNMIKHIGLNWSWSNNRTAQRTILDLQLPSGLWSNERSAKISYTNIDALFIAVRTLPWNPDRRLEVQSACAAFLKAATTFSKHDFSGRGLNDANLVIDIYKETHDLAAPIFAVSMCAQEFPQLVKTARPWTFSGNRAPFI